MLLIVAVLVSILYVVYSYPGYKDRIPNGGIISHPCFPGMVWGGLGHELVRGRGVRNPFGRDFEANGNVSNYRPSMKLREGNAFTGVCHSVGRGSHMVGYSSQTSDVGYFPSPGHQT